MMIGTPGETGHPPTHLTQPSDVPVAPNRQIYSRGRARGGRTGSCWTKRADVKGFSGPEGGRRGRGQRVRRRGVSAPHYEVGAVQVASLGRP